MMSIAITPTAHVDAEYQEHVYQQYRRHVGVIALFTRALETLSKKPLDAFSRSIATNALMRARRIVGPTSEDERTAVWMTGHCDAVVRAVAAGYTSDPGTSDLDREQPITVRMTLGEWRKACAVVREWDRGRA